MNAPTELEELANAANDYWCDPEDPLPPSNWNDPEPDVKGMLSSDWIAFYNAELGGRMIDPFRTDLLKAAGYNLTLGPLAMVEGRSLILKPEEPYLEIPPNSVAFVSMGERLCLPHYIAARFNLEVSYIYEGLLLGTGPQVDPGFQGVLSCPLHNISNAPVWLKFGAPFAKIDFEKTTGFAGSQQLDVENEKGLYSREMAGTLAGKDEHPVKLFRAAKRWKEPVFDSNYAGKKRPQSSVKRLDDQLRNLRRIGGGSLVGLAGLFLALTALNLQFASNRDDDIARLEEKVDVLERSAARAEPGGVVSAVDRSRMHPSLLRHLEGEDRRVEAFD